MQTGFLFGAMFFYFCSLAQVQHQSYFTLGLPRKYYDKISKPTKLLMAVFFVFVTLMSLWEATTKLIDIYHRIGQP